MATVNSADGDITLTTDCKRDLVNDRKLSREIYVCFSDSLNKYLQRRLVHDTKTKGSGHCSAIFHAGQFPLGNSPADLQYNVYKIYRLGSGVYVLVPVFKKFPVSWVG